MGGFPALEFGSAGFGQGTIPSGQMVLNLTRRILGDTEVTGGQIFTNAFLAATGGYPDIGPYQSAYQWLIERLVTYNDRRCRRVGYGVINKNIGYVNPQTIGLFTMGNPVDIWERQPITTYAVTGVSQTAAGIGTDPFVQLAVAHGGAIANGQMVDAYLFQGISDDINDEWCVNVPDNNHINLMGCTAIGTWTNPSGIIITSTQTWPSAPMTRQWDENDVPVAQSAGVTVFQRYAYRNGALRLPPASLSIELRIAYNLAANPPTDLTVGIGIADSLNVLAYRTAWIAAKSKAPQNDTDPADYLAQSEKLLQQFLQPSNKDLQRERLIPPRYRQKRNTGLYNPY